MVGLLLFISLATLGRTTHAVTKQTDAVIAPIGPTVALDEVGIYSIGCTYRDGRTKQFPVGWSGDFDESTGVAYRTYGEQHGRQATLLHCPWRGGTGISFQEFRIRVPNVPTAILKGAIALGTYAVGKSDGATFRIFVNGNKLLDENRTDDVWKEFSLDVSRFTGSVLIVRFETDPGPRDNASFDFSLWGDRRLVLNGLPSIHVAPRVSPPVDLVAASGPRSDVVPFDGDSGTSTVSAQGGTTVFRWTGVNGSMEYRWRIPQNPGDPLLGAISLKSTVVVSGNAQSTETPLGSSATIAWTGNANAVGVRPIQVGQGYGCERSYEVDGKLAHLLIVGRIVAKSLVFEISCDQPVVSAFEMGGWGPVAYRRLVTTPFYSGQVQYLPVQDIFVNSFLDWTHSRASAHEGQRATYGALTDGTHNPLYEQAIFAASWRLAGALLGPCLPFQIRSRPILPRSGDD